MINLKDKKKGVFSLKLYLLIVFALSWPFQFFIFFFPDITWAPKLFLVSMIMVSVGTFIAGRYFFKDTFRDAGWSWGKPKHYILALIFPIIIWVIPTLLGSVLGVQLIPTEHSYSNMLTLFLLSFVITLAPAFGEEFGWRGYLLPRLLQRHSVKKSLLIQSFIWWFWHIPVLIYSATSAPLIESSVLTSSILVLAISIIPSMMHAIIFSYIWSTTSSLAVATFYHASFDEIRDTTESTLGFGPFTQLWQMLVITIIGAIIFLKGKWKRLYNIKENLTSK